MILRLFHRALYELPQDGDDSWHDFRTELQGDIRRLDNRELAQLKSALEFLQDMVLLEMDSRIHRAQHPVDPYSPWGQPALSAGQRRDLERRA